MNEPQLPFSAYDEPGLEPCFRADWKKAHVPEWKKRNFRRGLLDQIASRCVQCDEAIRLRGRAWYFGKARRSAEDERSHLNPEVWPSEYCPASQLWDALQAASAPNYDWHGRHPELFE